MSVGCCATTGWGVTKTSRTAELDALLSWGARIALGHPPLHFHGAPDGVNDARELGQEAVTGVLDDAPPVFADLRLDQVSQVRLDPFVRPLLIGPHQTRIPGHIGGEDCG